MVIDQNNRTRFSAIVVTYNESQHLEECLASLSFCEQIVLVDLGSTDGCISIGRKFGADVFEHAWVPFVEKIRQEILSLAKNDWIISLDPDEVFPIELVPEINALITQRNDELGAVEIPLRHHFKGKRITSSFWSRLEYKSRILNRNRFCYPTTVHTLPYVREPFICQRVKSAVYFIKHYWSDSYWQLIKKHARYLRFEGEAKYSQGERFSTRLAIRKTYNALLSNLIDLKGLSNGWIGLFLSVFYSCYVLLGQFSLLIYENNPRSHKDHDL